MIDTTISIDTEIIGRKNTRARDAQELMTFNEKISDAAILLYNGVHVKWRVCLSIRATKTQKKLFIGLDMFLEMHSNSIPFRFFHNQSENIFWHNTYT